MTSVSLDTLQAIRLKVVEASPDAKIVINRLREIVDVNEEAEFLFGYARGDLLGKTIEELMPESYREGHVNHIANFFKSPRRREMGEGRKLEGLNRDGEAFPVKIRLAPILIEGPKEGGVYALAVVRRADL
jgi:PAS domain S-box-containing protein